MPDLLCPALIVTKYPQGRTLCPLTPQKYERMVHRWKFGTGYAMGLMLSHSFDRMLEEGP
jgi:hypothetical protein